MSQVTKEQIEQARQIDLLTYLQRNAPHELKHISGNVYSLRSHDSLKISNGKWYWWSQRIGGSTALDYLVKVEGINFTDAVEQLVGEAITLPLKETPAPPTEHKELTLPQQSDTPFRVMAYLSSRGIDLQIVKYCLKEGLIYESMPYHSVVFTGRDETGKPRYASWRATGEQRMMGDCSGSDKRYSFRIGDSNSNSVHFFEAAIDALSYATLLKRSGKDWTKESCVSLAGVAVSSSQKLPLAAEHFLKNNPQVKTVYLHLDSDEAGRSAAKAIKNVLERDYVVLDVPPPKGKDYNDFLTSKIAEERNRSLKREVRL